MKPGKPFSLRLWARFSSFRTSTINCTTMSLDTLFSTHMPFYPRRDSFKSVKKIKTKLTALKKIPVFWFCTALVSVKIDSKVLWVVHPEVEGIVPAPLKKHSMENKSYVNVSQNMVHFSDALKLALALEEIWYHLKTLRL